MLCMVTNEHWKLVAKKCDLRYKVSQETCINASNGIVKAAIRLYYISMGKKRQLVTKLLQLRT